ncbi:MAG: restriction endonuclease [Nitrososphaerales archaeon]|nr:restriction endonuclease [Nitrososphaerales archaeon]
MIPEQSNARRVLNGELTGKAEEEFRQLEFELRGSAGKGSPRVIRAILACRLGARLEEVAGGLDWEEFESFCADLFRIRGFVVEENLVIRRPRAQLDLLAHSDLVSLAVDCKHWKRTMGVPSLARCAEAQRRRARLLREGRESLKPIATVILLLADETLRFVGGAAVVPVRTLGSFLDGIAGYSVMLEFD